MKKFDLIRMASKNLKDKWVILPVAGIAISAFCLCFAGAVLTTVLEEKALPYELVLSADDTNNLSDKMLSDISQLPDVEAVSPLLLVPARVKTGEYSAQLMLTGIAPAYLEKGFTEGRVFPDNGVMPYIVLNESACKQFSDKIIETATVSDTGTGTGNNTKTSIGTAAGTKADTSSNASTSTSTNTNTNTNTETETGTETNTGTSSGADASVTSGSGDDTDAPKIDWLNAGVSTQSGDGRWIVSKVCGILTSDETEEPVAYISLSTAKDLLQKSGQSTDYTGANIRITNIGCADSVSHAIAALGLNVINTDTVLQAKWDTELKEMTYLIVIGAFCLLSTTVLLAARRKISMLEQQETWKMLQWIGMKEGDIGRLFVIQALMISLIGIVIGIIVSTSLPSFLSLELKETSIFALQTTFVITALSIAVCIAPVVLSFLNIKNKIDSD